MPLSALLFAGKYDSMTSFFSLSYLALFLPICIIIYSIVPKNFKKYFLLIASYSFFWLISGKLVIYLILSTLSMHYFGIWIDRIQKQRDVQIKLVDKEDRKALKQRYLVRQRWIILLAVFFHIGVLLTLKYSGFLSSNFNTILVFFKAPIFLTAPPYLVPIGISFFTMQALSYIFDVYRGIVKADENLFRLSLFIGFFPQIVQGPICRYNETAQGLWNAESIKFSNLTLGIQRILFGLMKKMVIANRLNQFITVVFRDHSEYEGGIIALAAIFYTIQLYMDFSGTLDAVIGTAQIFGIKLPENFKRPFFAKTISEFWKRWHITLGTWFKDYIFYPVSMSKQMKSLTKNARKKIGNHFGPLLAGSIALFIVWICNGMWHGAGWNYIFFGMYHFGLILCGSIITPTVKRINSTLHINSDWFAYRFIQIIRTAVLVIIGELFFRAHGLSAGLSMFKKILTNFSFTTFNDALLVKLGLDRLDILIVCVTLIIILVISILNEKGIIVRESLAKRNIIVRWIILYALILFIIIFGAYGPGYIPVDPIYANF